MARAKPKTEQHLGEIRTEVVGMQYYDGTLRPGEPVHLEREPDNAHDPNAIRVENRDFVQAGHVARPTAAWLAPLVDNGKLRVDAAVPAPEPDCLPGERGRLPLVLDAYLCEKGRAVLDPVLRPRTEFDALHETVRKAYEDAAAYDDAALTIALGERLRALAKHDVLPETHLLLALFPAQAQRARQRMTESVRAGVATVLADIELGQAMHYENLTIYPLVGRNGHEPGYSLLAGAIQEKTVDVEEASEEGDVPTLRVNNRGLRPVMITEGEILVGAKENRVVNITIIVAAGRSITLPVSCVEQGRWSYTSRHFDAAYCAPPSLRAATARSVQRRRAETGRAESDQAEVWQGVSDCLCALEAPSPTDSLTDGYRAAEDHLAEYRERFQLPDDATGFLVGKGERVLGADLFDSPSTLGRLWKRLADAYFIEAAGDRAKAKKTGKRAAKRFLSRIGAAVKPSDHPVGSGVELEIAGPDVVGSGVWFDDRLCHLSAFAVSPADQGQSPDTPPA